MPEETPITSTPPKPTSTPDTNAPEPKSILTGDIPETYGDYKSQQAAIPKPKFRLPLEKRYELLNNAEKFVYNASNAIGELFQKVSQPDFITNANTLANIHSDKIMQLTSVQPEEIKPEAPRTTELEAQAKAEAGTDIKDWAELVGKSTVEGTIIKVDPYFRRYDADFYTRLKNLNPTWTGEYVQMQRAKDGKVIPKAYNMAAVFQKDPKAFGQLLPGVDIYGSETISDKDVKQWSENAVRDATLDITTMTPKEFQDYEARAEKGFGLPDKVKYVLENNPALSRVFMQNEDLFKSFKEELDKAPEITSQSQQAQIMAKAVISSFGLNKKVSPLAYDVFKNMQGMRNLEASFNTMQGNLSAKMKVAGQAALRESGVGDKLDQYQILQARMLSNPSSITPDDQHRYAALTMELNDAISKAGTEALQQDWLEYQSNSKQFGEIIKSFPALLAAATTKEGSEGIDLMAKQQKGQYIYDNITKYFLEVANLEDLQAALDKRGRDKLSLFKSAVRGLSETGMSLSKDIVRFFGDDKGIFDMMKGTHEVSEIPWLMTPNRPTNTGNSLDDMVNDFANFGDKTAHGAGSIAIPLALSAVGGEALELGAFASQAHYETYNSLRNAGVDKDQAETAALVNGLLTAVTMKFAFLPSRIIREQISSMSMQEILDAAAGNGSPRYAIENTAKKLIPAGSDFKNAALAMVQQGAMNIANSIQQKRFGLQPPPEENAYSNMMQVGAITYFLGTLGRLVDRGAATQFARKYADDNPMMFATAMDNAKTEAIATGRYNLGRLKGLETDVWNHWKNTYGMPDNLTSSQKLAASHILDNLKYYKQQHSKADENLKPVWENKVRETQAQLNNVISDHEAAVKYNNSIVEPVMDHLRQSLPEEKPEPFKGIVVRHAATAANEHGKYNTSDEPLTDEGKDQAKKLGEELQAQNITKLISSPSKRSTETAEITGIPFETSNDLREWNTGSEGKPLSDFDYKYYVNHPEETPTGGESFNDFLGRVQKVRAAAGEMDENTGIITHGQVMKLWESVENSGGKWDENAKTEFLKDSNDFNNTEIYTPGGKPKKAGKKSGDSAAKPKNKADETGSKTVKQKSTSGSKEGLPLPILSGEPSISKNALRNERLGKVKKALGNAPESAEDAILQHFIRGGKINSEGYTRSTGFGSDKPGLNTGETRQHGSQELFGKKWALDPKGKPIDEFAEELAEQYGGDPRSYEQQIVDILSDHTKDQMRDRILQINDVRASPGESGYEEALHQHLTDEESQQMNDAMAEKLKDYVEEMTPEVQQELLKALGKYQDKYGTVDFKKLIEDTNGFTPELLTLSDEASAQINKIITDYEKGQEAAPAEAAGTIGSVPVQDVTGTAAEGKQQPDTAARKAAIDEQAAAAPAREQAYHDKRKALVDKYGKDIDEMIEDLKKEDRLKVDCPPGSKRRFSLKNLIKPAA